MGYMLPLWGECCAPDAGMEEIGRTPETVSSVGVLLYGVRFWSFSGFNMKQKRLRGPEDPIA